MTRPNHSARAERAGRIARKLQQADRRQAQVQKRQKYLDRHAAQRRSR